MRASCAQPGLVCRGCTAYSAPSMARDDPFGDFPQRVRVSLEQRDVFYAVVPGLFALHGGRAAPAGKETVFSFEDEGIVVCRGPAPGGAAAQNASPLYALGSGGSPAVPTGLVLVRFAERIRAESQHDALARAGYEIREVPPYAPHTAWVRAARGGLAASLSGIGRLEEMQDVVNVEPQMLRRAGRR